jgi:hypothetical protein
MPATPNSPAAGSSTAAQRPRHRRARERRGSAITPGAGMATPSGPVQGGGGPARTN